METLSDRPAYIRIQINDLAGALNFLTGALREIDFVFHLSQGKGCATKSRTGSGILNAKGNPVKKLAVWTILVPFAIASTSDLSFARGAENGGDRTFTVDVALDLVTLVVNSADSAKPPGSRGDNLLVDGTIYPEGTIPYGIGNFDPNKPGGIGKIRCRAVLLAPFSDLTTPSASFVTELYSLPDDNQTIITDGPGANLFATVYRVVLGGTRSFDGVYGQIIEREIGFNKTGGCNFRVTFKLKGMKYEGRDRD